MKTCEYPVNFSVTAKSTPLRLRRLGERLAVDAIDPLWYRCRSCGLVWDDSPLRDYEDVVCSNCYSERVMLVRVRLGFHNYGKQNGGKSEQIERRRVAMRAALRIDSLAQGIRLGTTRAESE